MHAVAVGLPILSPHATSAPDRRGGRPGDAAGPSSADRRRVAARAALEALTERELEVAAALGRGLSNQESGSALYLSVATVKAHVGRILTKLALENRTQVAILVHDADLGDDEN